MSGERPSHNGKQPGGPVRQRRDPSGAALIGLAAVVLGSALLAGGCGRSRTGTTDPPAKLRLEKLFEFYQTYARQKKMPPPNEQAFKDFLRALPAEEKKIANIGDNVDDFLVSPRDGQKYVIRYGRAVDPGGATRAVAWEQAGKDGKRFVALSVGYVQECDEETFKSYAK